MVTISLQGHIPLLTQTTSSSHSPHMTRAVCCTVREFKPKNKKDSEDNFFGKLL